MTLQMRRGYILHRKESKSIKNKERGNTMAKRHRETEE
jgi:hypothetical protein